MDVQFNTHQPLSQFDRRDRTQADETHTTTPSAKDCHNIKKRTRGNVLVIPGINGQDFSIDEDDYLTLLEIYGTYPQLNDFKIEEDGINRRVRQCFVEYRFSYGFSFIRQLPNLESLCSGALPSWIGMLKNLKVLSSKEIPEEIGDLSQLIKLDLKYSDAHTLPFSIGRLQNLRELDLSFTGLLRGLPDEIGDLVNLKILNLEESSIYSLPTSIGSLRSLEKFCISDTMNLSLLPEEVGNLANLRILEIGGPDKDRGGTQITALPSSIGNLANVRVLNLEHLELDSTLPECVGRMSSLMYLEIFGLQIPELYDNDNAVQFCLMLARRHKALGYIDISEDSYTWRRVDFTKVHLALAFNRARFRNRLGDTGVGSIGTTMKFWPNLIAYSVRAFDGYLPFSRKVYRNPKKYSIPKPDAVFWFLLRYRESFICLLIDRNRRGNSSREKIIEGDTSEY